MFLKIKPDYTFEDAREKLKKQEKKYEPNNEHDDKEIRLELNRKIAKTVIMTQQALLARDIGEGNYTRMCEDILDQSVLEEMKNMKVHMATNVNLSNQQ